MMWMMPFVYSVFAAVVSLWAIDTWDIAPSDIARGASILLVAACWVVAAGIWRIYLMDKDP